MTIREEMQKWLADQKLKAEKDAWLRGNARADSDDSEGRWVTINGSHVLIGKDGRVVGGAGGKLNGETKAQVGKGEEAKTVTKEAKTEITPAEKKSAEKSAEKSEEKKEEPAAEDKNRPKRWDGTPNPPGALETDPPEEREAYIKKELAELVDEYKQLKSASPVDWKAIHKNSDRAQTLRVQLKRHQEKQAEDAAVAKDPSTITAAEKSAVKVYSSASYESINKQLRSGKEESGGMYNHEIGVLDKALNKKTLPTGTKLKRYIDAAGIKQLFGGEPKVGSVGTDKAFMSTSDSKTWEKNEHQLVMETPAGQKGLKLGNMSKYEEEGEVLLPRGTSLRVTSIGTSKGKKLIKCEIVQDGETKADSVPGTASITPMEYVEAMMARCHGAGINATRLLMAKNSFLETHGTTAQSLEEYSSGVGQRFLLAFLNECGVQQISDTADLFDSIRADADLKEGEHWVTMNGTHVLIGKDGRVKSGAEGKFNGQTEAQMGKGEETKGGGKDAPTEPVTVQKAGPDTGNKKIPAPPEKGEDKPGAKEEPPVADELGDLNKQLIEAEAELDTKQKEFKKVGASMSSKAKKTSAEVSSIIDANKAVTAALAKLDKIKQKLKVAAKVSETMPTANPQNEINKQKQEAQESTKQEQDFQTQQEKEKREHELKKEEMKSAAGKESAPGPTTTTEKTTEKVAANGGKTVTKEAKTETAPAPAEKKQDQQKEKAVQSLAKVTDANGEAQCADIFKNESEERFTPDVPDSAKKTQTVDIDKLFPMQDAVNSKHVKALIEGKDVQKSSERPVVINLDGKLCIIDGHHRLAAASLMGEKQMEVDVAKVKSYDFTDDGEIEFTWEGSDKVTKNDSVLKADIGVAQLPHVEGEKIAAGVLFITDSGYTLLGQRAEPGEYQGHWGIFGGHAEPGEPLELTAMREVLEETGHEIEQSQVEGEAPPLQLIAETELDGTKFSYFINVCKPFEVRLNDEHTTYGWFAMGAMPEPLIPGLQEVIDSDLVKGLRLRKMNETDVARAMAWGALPSPMKFANVSMYKMRITGTGAAFRSGQPEIKNADGKVTQVALKDEHCFRPPEHYLNEDFLERCQGLNLIFEHPKKRILNSKEFNDRKVGNIVQPYIWGDEVWGIGKVYDQDTIDILDHEVMSTSPAVQFGDNDGNTIIPLSDGSQMLIEGKARLLDHLAICEQGVWDKGGPPTGIISESAK